ncbi:cAMP-dependent protein kinase catalytic subunit alpha-like [Leptidea sinapis]|uniref:cAMP-dependent protein kinase catalytic subunit alpha-like n=1 Tax=Leptidea sinapis TaxID=189913 RepID=UPI0021C39B4B|nr:cAMP-dependent protein kinase catalytic subunit alpha-like [Leptidea sinapis]
MIICLFYNLIIFYGVNNNDFHAMTFDRLEDRTIATYSHEQQFSHTKFLDVIKQDFLHKYYNPVNCTKPVEEFDLVVMLGQGSFGQVFLVRNKSTLDYYAMKALEKEEIIKKNNVKQLLQEKKILESVKFPFLLNLDFFSKDNLYVYLITSYESGGELFNVIKKFGNLSEPLAQFYGAQMVLALECLHHCGIVHRDLKPENIFLNETGYLKLGDYGFCKVIKSRTWTLCGTPEFIAPEMILSKGYSFAVDWWSLGILIFEMNAGYPPFYHNDSMKLYEKILSGNYKSPDYMTPACKSLVKNLLIVDPMKRYGSLKTGVFDIKKHAWFSEIDWSSVLQQKMYPPYKPVMRNPGDISISEEDDIKLKRSPKCLYEKEFEIF